jgi:hypothetical protein
MMGGGMMGGGVLGLIRSKTVSEEIKITDEQKEKLKGWAVEFMPRMTEIMKEKMAGIDFQDREKLREVMSTAQAEMSRVVYKELGDVLQPEQIKRLQQIEVQMDGMRAFEKPFVKDALKLNEEQLGKIKDAADASLRDLRELGEEYGLRFPGQRPMDAEKAKEYDKKVNTINKEALGKVLASFSDEQKKAWEELNGATIDVAKIREESFGGFRPKRKDD